MWDFILNLLNFNICRHENVENTKSLCYCPDCGKLIRINWYIIRCSCCGKKRIGVIRGNKVVPIAKFCSNCGTNEYFVEKIRNLNFFDMNFAVARKEEESAPYHPEIIQTWCEEVEILENLRLLSNHLN